MHRLMDMMIQIFLRSGRSGRSSGLNNHSDHYTKSVFSMVSGVEWSQWLHFKLLGKIADRFLIKEQKK